MRPRAQLACTLAPVALVSGIHRKKMPRRPMSETSRRANAIKAKVRSGVEHIFAVPGSENALIEPLQTSSTPGGRTIRVWPAARGLYSLTATGAAW
jgi:hypothetical protein